MTKSVLLLSCLLLFAGQTVYFLWPGKMLGSGLRADKVMVIKHKRRLQLIKDGEVVKAYKVSLGGNPKGPKTCQGDNKTPEGNYTLDWKNNASKYHLSIHVSYPNQADVARAEKIGCSPGGDIMIHGLPNGNRWIGKSHRLADWTLGCIAVTDREIEEIWKVVPTGTPIEIKP